MKLTINTQKLKDMISKSIVGAGNDKLIPITTFMGITKHNDNIMLTTTDATNYLYVTDVINNEQDDIQVTVFVDQFAKLISRMTSENVELEVVNDALHIVGNGDYMLELPLDENGELVTYPDPAVEVFGNSPDIDTYSISLADVKTVLDTVRPSLSTDNTNFEITNYFVGNSVLATDSYKIASFDINLLDAEYLVSPNMLDLFKVVSQETVYYKIKENSIWFTAGDIMIYGKLMEGAYPVDVLEKLLSEKFPSVCKINKSDFLSLLDRISLFVSKNDDKAIKMNFTKTGIEVTNKAGKSAEIIEYQSVKKHKDFSCIIDIEFLTTQIKAYASDVIELHYGRENSIKLVDGNIIQIVALNE